MKQISRKLENIYIPPIVARPSPPLFLAACITFAFTIAALRHSHRHDRFQDHFLFASIVVGIATASISDNFLMRVKTLVPWSVIFALALSSFAHRVLGLFTKTGIDASGGVGEWESGRGDVKNMVGGRKSRIEGLDQSIKEISTKHTHQELRSS